MTVATATTTAAVAFIGRAWSSVPKGLPTHASIFLRSSICA